MVTRLIHLDVVSDLSTLAFLNMLRRFFGRRGVPKSITSDNAPTFLLGETILAECIGNLEQYKQVTPFAPWQGGFYERLVKTVKHSLYKTLKKSYPTFEEIKSTSLPRKDDCVLISNPIQPRHCWRMGRIKELVLSTDGEAREAIIILPSKRQIRRP
ncbi:unnamed protein product, partial [Strongylus vulgaris]